VEYVEHDGIGSFTYVPDSDGARMAGGFGDFGTLTEALTAAAVDPSRWDPAMDAAARATESFGAVLLPVRGRTPTMPISESMQPTIDAYVRQDWVHRDERYRSLPVFMRRGVACEFDFTTSEAMARSPFYQELLRPHGLEWFAVVKVGGGADVWGLSLQRSVEQGPFSPHELDQLAGLSRRLAGVAELARAFDFSRTETALAAFEVSHSPVAMIDRKGEVVQLNRSAERLLGCDLQIIHRRIVSWSRDATQALDRALHDLIWQRVAEACQPPVVLPRRGGRPIIAYPSRLSGAVREGLALVQGFVVFVDLGARPAAIGADLMRVFALTAAEARLADSLLHEESLEAAAEHLGVAYSTARNQLRAIYQKTDTHSQGQLMALISRLYKPQIRSA
jgi:DNA-binding CsgD family transcriptional regulator/PAS domain-containing protein